MAISTDEAVIKALTHLVNSEAGTMSAEHRAYFVGTIRTHRVAIIKRRALLGARLAGI